MQKEPVNHTNTNPSTDDIDLGAVTKAVIDLHIARRTLLIYPISHEQVKRSIIKAFKSIGQATDAAKGITLVVLKEGIGIDGRVLEARSTVLTDFAGILKHYEIATVTFQKGLKINELARFLRLICLDRGKIMSKGGIVAVAGELKFKAIRIQAVDYSQLQLTEEEEIHRGEEGSEEKRSVWQQFVTNLTSTQHINDEIFSGINPGNLAQIMNQKGLDIDLAVQHYKTTIANASSEGTGDQSLAQELLAFQEMIKELDEGIKEQFLSATFDHCGQLSTISDAAHLIDGLGGDLIVQMLRQASSTGKKISPSLLSFIKKMGYAEGLPADVDGGDHSTAQGFSTQSVESLLAHEQYDTYVDSDYGKLLGQLSGDVRSRGSQQKPQTLDQEIRQGLTGAGIHTHAGRAITYLMLHSTETAGYRDWARQLTYLLDDLIEHGAYDYLTQVMTLVRLEKKSEDPERAEIAGLVLDRFSDPQFVAKAIESAQASADGDDPKALAFFMELGEPVVVEIFDGLDPDQTFLEQNMLTQILQNLKSLTAKEALERIKDPRPDYVRRMIRIIRKMGDGASAEQIRSLMDHPDMDVRMEALKTLLEFENNWGLVRLRDLLNDPSAEGFDKAAGLAGRYRVGSVVPQLEAIAGQRGEAAPREAAIRALGHIGDPRVIPTLTKIARTRWSMAKSQIRYLKRVVFETLDGYPTEAVHHLLRLGLKQKDADIRAACERLLRQGGRANEQTDPTPSGE